MGLLHSRSKSHRRLKMLVNVCLDNYLLNHRMICHQTWYGYAALWAKASCRKTGSLYSMLRSQRGLIYSKYDYFCCIFLTAGWFATKLGLVVQHYKLECPFEKWDYCVKVKVTAKVQNVSECLSRWYFLNYRTFCYQIWYGEVASWARVSCGNFVVVVVAIFKVKVTARAHMIKIWLFLLYFLNCWFLGNQNWSSDTSS